MQHSFPPLSAGGISTCCGTTSQALRCTMHHSQLCKCRRWCNRWAPSRSSPGIGHGMSEMCMDLPATEPLLHSIQDTVRLAIAEGRYFVRAGHRRPALWWEGRQWTFRLTRWSQLVLLFLISAATAVGDARRSGRPSSAARLPESPYCRDQSLGRRSWSAHLMPTHPCCRGQTGPVFATWHDHHAAPLYPRSRSLPHPYASPSPCPDPHLGVSSPLHYDAAHNVYCQLIGAKRFVLIPPEEAPNLYSYPRLHPSTRQSQLEAREPPLAFGDDRFGRFFRRFGSRLRHETTAKTGNAWQWLKPHVFQCTVPLTFTHIWIPTQARAALSTRAA